MLCTCYVMLCCVVLHCVALCRIALHCCMFVCMHACTCVFTFIYSTHLYTHWFNMSHYKSSSFVSKHHGRGEELPKIDFHGQMWSVTQGACEMDSKGCIVSPGFPSNYTVDSYCTIAINSASAVPIHVEEFATEPGFDPWLLLALIPRSSLQMYPQNEVICEVVTVMVLW